MFNKSISIIGGAGHVGAPLGLAFSSKGYKVVLIDKNIKNIKKINNKMIINFIFLIISFKIAYNTAGRYKNYRKPNPHH